MKKKIALILAIFLLIASASFATAEKKATESNIGLLRNGIQFGDSYKTVKQNEKFSLNKEEVDGVSAVWGADDVKLRGVPNSSISYLFNANDELFEVYEYFDQMATVQQGKKDYEFVQSKLENILGEPLSKTDHVTINTAGFDVDDFVSTCKKYNLKVSISERDMWIVELDHYIVTVDHVGVSMSDTYKHYLFIVAEEKKVDNTATADAYTEEIAKPSNFKFLDSTILNLDMATDAKTLCSEGLRETILISFAVDYLQQTKQSQMDLTPNATFIGYNESIVYAVIPVIKGETLLFELDLEYEVCKYYKYDGVEAARNEELIKSYCGTNYWGTEWKALESALYAALK